MHYRTCTGGLSPCAHLRFVAAYETDVVLDPLKDSSLVVESGIGETFLFHGRTSEETIGAELVSLAL